MQLEATSFTFEDRPIAVSFSDMPALGALLGGVSGINKINGDTLSQSLIFNKALESGKAPAMHLSVALPTEVSPAPNMGQLLKDDNGAIVSRSVAYQPLTDLVQYIPMEAVLPTTKSLKSSPSASGAFALKGFPHPKVVVSMPVELSCLKELVGAGNSDILNSQVDPNHLARSSRRWNKLFKDEMQVESLVSINKVCRAKLPRLILKIASLVTAQGKITPHPVSIGGEGAVRRFDGAGSGIVADGGKGEVWLGVFSLKARLHSFSHLIPGTTSKVCRQLKKLSSLIIDLMVKGNLVGQSLLPSYIANPVAGIRVCPHRLKEKGTILWQKLYSNCPFNLLHIHILKEYRQFVKFLKGGLSASSAT